MKKPPTQKLAAALAAAIQSAPTPQEKEQRLRRARQLGDAPSSKQIVQLIASFAMPQTPELTKKRLVLLPSHVEDRVAAEERLEAEKSAAELAKTREGKAELKRRRKAEKRLRDTVSSAIGRGPE